MIQVYDSTDDIQLTAEVDVLSYKGCLIRGMFGIPMESTKAGHEFVLRRKGQFAVPVEAQVGTISQGDPIYWKAGRADAEFHNNAESGDRLVGYAAGFPPSGSSKAPANGLLAAAGAVVTLRVAIEPCHQAAVA
jgi:predicted RecA/RadA family phage recombinase